MSTAAGKSKVVGVVSVLISAVLFSFGGVLIKMIPWSSISINASRSIIAFFIIGLYMTITKHRFVFNRSVMIGALCNTAMSLSFVMATKMTSAANAIVLQFTEPIFVILILWAVFKSRPHKAEVIACCVAFCGMIFFFLDQLSATGMIGNMLAILSGLTYSGVFLIKKMPGGDMESAMLISYIISFIIGLPSIFKETDWSGSVMIFVLILAVVQYSLPYIFLSKGLDRVSPVTASLTSMIEPILNPVWVAMFYGEHVGKYALFGAVLIIGASVGYQVYQNKKAAASTTHR